MSTLKKKIIMIGYSGHSYEIIECLRNDNYDIIGYFEIQKKEKNPFSLKYLGNEKDFEIYKEENCFFISIGDNKTREKISKKLVSNNLCQVNVIHKESSLSNNLKQGFGNFISRNASVNFNSIIKNNVIVNTGSIIEHDCIINSYSHIGPGAVLCGGVNIGESTFIGANSVVNQNIIIGNNVIVGSGTVVIKNIPDNTKVVGNPGRII
ncbi:MAG: acetyltransferase [Flavobacteriaceae bacterium]|jgi:sugar O-acyltransferase (sialic acid O-acetyltransferase NeuD family)|nr:acetyltransferase [Flavobacteriaceae bacterium]